MKILVLRLANLLEFWAGKNRPCNICAVEIQDFTAIIRDYHVCSECWALTRDLAKRRRKERKKRAKLSQKGATA